MRRLLLLLLLAVGGGAALLWLAREPAAPASAAPAIEVVTPSGTVNALPSSCRWKPIAGARLYQITVLDSAGNALGASYTNRSSAELSPDLRRRLQPGGTYLWQVVATGADGKVVGSSQLTRFRIALPSRRGSD
jgi:hypothetical protein